MDALFEIFREYIDSGGSLEVAKEAMKDLARLTYPNVPSASDLRMMFIANGASPKDKVFLLADRTEAAQKEAQAVIEQVMEKLRDNES